VQTGNQLDFALNSPDTFFKIKDNNGNILLTRDGSFKNLNGFLATGNGESVLNNNNQAIAIEEGFEQNISIVQTDYNNIYKIGNNNYKFDNNQVVTPVINLENQIVQGALEKSNINSVSTMVGLIDAQRRLEQAQRAITGLSQMSEKLLQKIDGR
jgi:flagellar basal-body rod protein FlgG